MDEKQKYKKKLEANLPIWILTLTNFDENWSLTLKIWDDSGEREYITEVQIFSKNIITYY